MFRLLEREIGLIIYLLKLRSVFGVMLLFVIKVFSDCIFQIKLALLNEIFICLCKSRSDEMANTSILCSIFYFSMLSHTFFP